MKKIWLFATTCLTILLMTNTSDAAGNLQINYTLTFPEAQAHYTDVEMNISGITDATLNLKMPVWTPGSYLVREFAKSVESFSAAHDDVALPAKKINKNTWQITLNGAKSIKVKYRVYCFEVSVRTSFVDVSHGFISGTGIFLYPEGKIDQASTVHIKPYKGWTTVSSSLDMVGNDQFTRTAPNYDILFDSPIEIGTQDVISFDASGVKYEIAMCLGGNYNRERLKVDMAKLVEKETAIFGENPNKHYVFIVHNLSKSGGGLEHLSSTVLGVVRDSYGTEAGYQRFLGLAAHEHFHLWNVKRLRPIALGPFNYDEENYTTDLWIAEGFTNYFDNLVVHRLGLYTHENYLAMLAGDINQIENAPGNKLQPVVEASFDAWIKYYRPNENSINTGVSYYSKGSVIAMMLDLQIINNSKGKYSLDDVMKYMYTEYYKTKKRGYTEDEFKAGLEKFTGENLDDFYKKYIYGVADVDYKKYLGYAGLQAVNELANDNSPSLGIAVVTAGGKTAIASVLRGSAGWVDGLNANDEIIGINGAPFIDVNASMIGRKVGDKVTVNVLRDGLPRNIEVTLKKNQAVKYSIISIDKPSAQQLMVRNTWLKQ